MMGRRLRYPPSVSPHTRHEAAPELVVIYAGLDALIELNREREAQERFNDPWSVFALPPGRDPAGYHWLVAGRNVKIEGRPKRRILLRLMSILIRHDAVAVAGVDDQNEMHHVPVPAQEVRCG